MENMQLQIVRFLDNHCFFPNFRMNTGRVSIKKLKKKTVREEKRPEEK